MVGEQRYCTVDENADLMNYDLAVVAGRYKHQSHGAKKQLQRSAI